MISIVIPAYNEEKRLPKMLGLTIDYLTRRNIKNEIIIVADKSKDDTLSVVQDFSKKFKNITYIFNPKKLGKGYAVRKGILKTKGDLVLFCDADTSTQIDELDKFLKVIKVYDVVIGSRAHKDSIVKKTFSRTLLGKLGNILIRIFLIKDIKDTQCGFKLFRGDAAKRLFSMSRINGFGFDFEIIFLAQKFNYRIHESPVRWTSCEGTKVTWQSHFQTLFELFQIIMYNLSGYYSR